MEYSITVNQAIYAIVAIASPMGAIAYALKKKGLITFGKPEERRKCSQVCLSHDELTKDIKKIDEKVDIISNDVAAIKGYLKGRNGY